MMTVREGRREQWRRFHLARDIPTELVDYVEGIATQIEAMLEAGQNFDDAASVAFSEADASQLTRTDYREVTEAMLLDLWVHEPELRRWLDKLTK